MSQQNGPFYSSANDDEFTSLDLTFDKDFLTASLFPELAGFSPLHLSWDLSQEEDSALKSDDHHVAMPSASFSVLLPAPESNEAAATGLKRKRPSQDGSEESASRPKAIKEKFNIAVLKSVKDIEAMIVRLTKKLQGIENALVASKQTRYQQSKIDPAEKKKMRMERNVLLAKSSRINSKISSLNMKLEIAKLEESHRVKDAQLAQKDSFIAELFLQLKQKDETIKELRESLKGEQKTEQATAELAINVSTPTQQVLVQFSSPSALRISGRARSSASSQTNAAKRRVLP